MWMVTIHDGGGSREDAARPALALALDTEQDAEALAAEFSDLLTEAGGYWEAQCWASHFEVLSLGAFAGTERLGTLAELPEPSALFRAWRADYTPRATSPAPPVMPPLSALNDSLFVTVPLGRTLDLSMMRAAGVGREAELRAVDCADLLYEPGTTVGDVLDDLEEELRRGPDPWLYKTRTTALGTELEFFTHHGVGDDECGSLLYEVFSVLSVPALLAASGAVAVSVR